MSKRSCGVYSTVCTTLTFMFGIIIGALIHTDNSLLNVVTSIVLATTVFHFTIIKNYNINTLVTKVIKKGS